MFCARLELVGAGDDTRIYNSVGSFGPLEIEAIASRAFQPDAFNITHEHEPKLR